MAKKLKNFVATAGEIRAMVRGAYDIQKLRIAVGNRVTGNWKDKYLGQHPGTSEKDLAEKAQGILKQMRQEYDRITDGVVIRRLELNAFSTGEGLISSFAEFSLIGRYNDLLRNEEEAMDDIAKMVKYHPLWQWTKTVTGCGPTMTAVLISEIDIHECRHHSNLHAYAGLDLGPDGKGRNRTAEHLVERVYKDKDGKEQTRQGIKFNPFLKTKLVGVLGTSFLRCGGHYREVYDNYKHRIETDPRHAEKTPAHRNNMAIRYTVKIFLGDLHTQWCLIEGLPPSKSYHEAVQGYIHGVTAA